MLFVYAVKCDFALSFQPATSPPGSAGSMPNTVQKHVSSGRAQDSRGRDVLLFENEWSIRLACENARFAVYAWVDELLLQSPRLDAADWLSHSLQYRYCGTTSAGREFFTRLTGIIRNALPLAENAPTAANEEEELADEVLRALEAFVLHGGDELSAAAVRVYALCLLYGFKGMLRDTPETLNRCRKAARALLLRDEPPPTPSLPQEGPIAPVVAVALEKAAYIILPPVIVLLFGALCAAVLADIPLPKF